MNKLKVISTTGKVQELVNSLFILNDIFSSKKEILKAERMTMQTIVNEIIDSQNFIDELGKEDIVRIAGIVYDSCPELISKFMRKLAKNNLTK